VHVCFICWKYYERTVSVLFMFVHIAVQINNFKMLYIAAIKESLSWSSRTPPNHNSGNY